MITLSYDFTGVYGAKAGADFTKRITWKNPNGSLVNLTGYTGLMQVRKKAGDPLIAEFKTSDSTMVLGGVNGTIDLDQPGSVTKDWPPGEYQYDIELYSSGGRIYCILEGAFEIKPNITVEE